MVAMYRYYRERIMSFTNATPILSIETYFEGSITGYFTRVYCKTKETYHITEVANM
jgi:hypothetical protein